MIAEIKARFIDVLEALLPDVHIYDHVPGVIEPGKLPAIILFWERGGTIRLNGDNTYSLNTTFTLRYYMDLFGKGTKGSHEDESIAATDLLLQKLLTKPSLAHNDTGLPFLKSAIPTNFTGPVILPYPDNGSTQFWVTYVTIPVIYRLSARRQ